MIDRVYMHYGDLAILRSLVKAKRSRSSIHHKKRQRKGHMVVIAHHALSLDDLASNAKSANSEAAPPVFLKQEFIQ